VIWVVIGMAVMMGCLVMACHWFWLTRCEALLMRDRAIDYAKEVDERANEMAKTALENHRCAKNLLRVARQHEAEARRIRGGR
jgi:hypothetical protein